MVTQAPPLLTIKAVAQLTGVAAPTLRAWERRYGIASPERTAGGYRVYNERAIAEIRAMQRLLQAGSSPRLAAEAVLTGRSTGPATTDAPASELPSTSDFLAASRALDEQRMGQLLDQALAAVSFEAFLDHWLFNLMQQIGEQWRGGELGIAAEHLASSVVMRRLSALYEAAGPSSLAPRILVGLPPTAVHEIPALAFATVARRSGLGAVYLGPDLPAESWAEAASEPQIQAVVLSLATAQDAAGALDVVKRVRLARPDILIAAGGAGASLLPAGAMHLSGRIPESVAQLEAKLRPAI